MAYSRNLQAAAARHLEDGKLLESSKRFDNAGYHFGLAAECALKAAFIALGERALLQEGKSQKAYYAHFPALKGLSVNLSGRISAQVASLLNSSSFLQDWDIRMRYAGKCISKERSEKWRKDAESMVRACAGI